MRDKLVQSLNSTVLLVMQNSDFQSNDFRSATDFHSLRRSRSDNTFATARNLGRISANATRISFRAKGTVGKSDKVDFYKFTVDPRVNLPFGNGRYRLKKGPATFSLFTDVQGERRFATKFTLRRGSTSVADYLTNPSQVPITLYLKVERRAGETQYNFAFNFFR